MEKKKVRVFPRGWGEDEVTKFFNSAEEQSYVTFQTASKAWKRLVEINDLFALVYDYVENSKEHFSLLFFLKARSAFFAALRLGTATQISETYMVLRGALENALYGWYLHKNPDLQKVWLKRHENDDFLKQVKKEFQIWKILDLLKKNAPEEGRIARLLYDRCIDFGAHPSELSLSSSLKITETEKMVKFDVSFLTSDETTIMLCLKTTAQVGCSCLKILELVMPVRFRIAQLDVKLKEALRGL